HNHEYKTASVEFGAGSVQAIANFRFLLFTALHIYIIQQLIGPGLDILAEYFVLRVGIDLIIIAPKRSGYTAYIFNIQFKRNLQPRIAICSQLILYRHT